MADRSKGASPIEREKLRFVRWVLLLINAAEASGIGALRREHLHALLFLSFASSTFYGIKPLRLRANRTPQGPYYRQAHVALGLLAMSNLVEVRRFEPHPSTERFQFEGTFSATLDGLNVGRVLRQAPQGDQLYRFLLDLCLGTVRGVLQDETDRARPDGDHPTFAALKSDLSQRDQPEEDKQSSDRLKKVFAADLTYKEAVARQGPMLFINEGDPDSITPTAARLTQINKFLSARIEVNRRDVLGAYQKILAERAT